MKNSPSECFPRLFKTVDAAPYLNVSRKTLLKYCRQKRITFIRYPDGSLRFREAALNLFLAHHTIPAKAA